MNKEEILLYLKELNKKLKKRDIKGQIGLLNHLKIKSVKQAFNIIEKYFPPNRIPPKTEYFLMELFEQGKGRWKIK